MPSQKEGNSSHDRTQRREGERERRDDRPRPSRFRSRSRSRERHGGRRHSRDREGGRKRRWSRSRSRSRDHERGERGRGSKWDQEKPQEKPAQPVISNVYDGKVTSIMSFGCFVQLEGEKQMRSGAQKCGHPCIQIVLTQFYVCIRHRKPLATVFSSLLAFKGALILAHIHQ